MLPCEFLDDPPCRLLPFPIRHIEDLVACVRLERSHGLALPEHHVRRSEAEPLAKDVGEVGCDHIRGWQDEITDRRRFLSPLEGILPSPADLMQALDQEPLDEIPRSLEFIEHGFQFLTGEDGPSDPSELFDRDDRMVRDDGA